MQYPPPYQDVDTLSRHLCMSIRTIERMVKEGELPPPIERAGKRLWRWRDVDAAMQAMARAKAGDAELERIRQATRRLNAEKPP